MKISDLCELPFFRRNTKFVHVVKDKEEELLLSDEIEDIIYITIRDELIKIPSDKSTTGFFMAPNPIMVVRCLVKEEK